jgi:UDP-GlcNAc:undecaprenyl-phosphate GlcNAc-1-phosphate transferase
MAMPALLAFLVTLGLTPLMRRLALRTGLLDHPAARKIHRQPTPLLGGLAIYAGAMTGLLAVTGGDPEPALRAIALGATLLVVVGLLDDAGRLHHQIKLFAGMPAAAALLLVSGVRLHLVTTLAHGGHALDTALTLLWVVGVTAAFSILDHMDGLCAGTAALTAAGYAVLAILSGQPQVAVVAAVTAAAALGFLGWNFHPASIFMGDAGAMLLGFLVAASGLLVAPPANGPLHATLVRALILLLPAFDTLLVSVSRLRRGLLPFAAPGTDHTAHRLAAAGMTQRAAVVTLYGVSVVGILLAVAAARATAGAAEAIAVAVGCAGVAAIVALERSGAGRSSRR